MRANVWLTYDDLNVTWEPQPITLRVLVHPAETNLFDQAWHRLTVRKICLSASFTHTPRNRIQRNSNVDIKAKGDVRQARGGVDSPGANFELARELARELAPFCTSLQLHLVLNMKCSPPEMSVAVFVNWKVYYESSNIPGMWITTGKHFITVVDPHPHSCELWSHRL